MAKVSMIATMKVYGRGTLKKSLSKGRGIFIPIESEKSVNGISKVANKVNLFICASNVIETFIMSAFSRSWY